MKVPLLKRPRPGNKRNFFTLLHKCEFFMHCPELSWVAHEFLTFSKHTTARRIKSVAVWKRIWCCANCESRSSGQCCNSCRGGIEDVPTERGCKLLDPDNRQSMAGTINQRALARTKLRKARPHCLKKTGWGVRGGDDSPTENGMIKNSSVNAPSNDSDRRVFVVFCWKIHS